MGGCQSSDHTVSIAGRRGRETDGEYTTGESSRCRASRSSMYELVPPILAAAGSGARKRVARNSQIERRRGMRPSTSTKWVITHGDLCLRRVTMSMMVEARLGWLIDTGLSQGKRRPHPPESMLRRHAGGAAGAYCRAHRSEPHAGYRRPARPSGHTRRPSRLRASGPRLSMRAPAMRCRSAARGARSCG